MAFLIIGQAGGVDSITQTQARNSCSYTTYSRPCRRQLGLKILLGLIRDTATDVRETYRGWKTCVLDLLSSFYSLVPAACSSASNGKMVKTGRCAVTVVNQVSSAIYLFKTYRDGVPVLPSLLYSGAKASF